MPNEIQVFAKYGTSTTGFTFIPLTLVYFNYIRQSQHITTVGISLNINYHSAVTDFFDIIQRPNWYSKRRFGDGF
jgi:hypothetical protein